MALPGRRESTEERPVVRDGDRYRVAGEIEEPDGELQYGPSDLGGFLRFTPDPDRTPPGPSLAPRVVDAFVLADELWDTGIGRLTTAQPRR